MIHKFFRIRRRDYRISVNNDDWVMPEDTLVDSTSTHSDVEMPISDGIFQFTFSTICISLLIIFSWVFRMGVVEGADYLELAERNKTVNFSVAPPRGIITDRNGKVLVKNIPSFDLLVVSRDLPGEVGKRKEEVARVARALGENEDEFSGYIRGLSQKNAVFFAALNLPKEKVLAVKNLNPRGFYVLTGTRRLYPDGHQFSHIIGYVGKVSRDDLQTDPYYLMSDSIGRTGVEASYETELRGEHGKITFTKKDEQGVSQEPVVGNTVVLNLDYELQKKLYNEMFSILLEANLSAASAVIQNPNNGEVLAMVSFPSFDNNIFSDSVSQEEFSRIFESKLRPLFNRAIGGLYNPGSTIKPFIGMAGLSEGIITPSDTIRDCINITIPNPADPSDPYVFSNWRHDTGLFNLRRAIAQSCNIYFFAVGGGFERIAGLGITKIAKFLNIALADKILGIDLPGEAKGFVPTPAWKLKTRSEPWYQGDTYNVSIGQGDLLVTPLWLNAYVSAIANGGTIWQPRVAGKITDHSGSTAVTINPVEVGRLPFTDAAISEVRSAMRETVVSGTAKLLQAVPVAVSAKTGTAEVIKGRRINALFTSFAPSEKPEIAMTVLVEGSAENQGYALRVANAVLKWHFSR